MRATPTLGDLFRLLTQVLTPEDEASVKIDLPNGSAEITAGGSTRRILFLDVPRDHRIDDASLEQEF